MDKLTFLGFFKQMNSRFTVNCHEQSELEMTLIEANQSGASPHQECFSLLFLGPKAPLLSQGTYHMKHGEMGELDLFIVPVGKTNEGIHYEAVINRQK